MQGGGVTLAAGMSDGQTYVYDLRRLSGEPGMAGALAIIGTPGPEAVSSLHWQTFPTMVPQPLGASQVHNPKP